ncbi:iron chelate uptake ABC transporter family permease subunit [Paracoccus litorisediminis]|uniref:Iron chelate uptake ABC transporter family permease subunit n=1 Tax=Paracoccus litorisediminis TaxID=2006130 RepID=A0A844HGN2_9RHOB|nr:iron chelate uptake ABC transporter family permease subunit [Paracoccus litorisediminis]MTH58980.1 iron chelate uptake ABC transporter family permease subunit [Paracoccus litorisediminis]
MRLLPAAMLVLAGLSVASLTIGAASVSILEATRDPWAALVLMESRLPRTLAVILTGAALAVAGVVLQALVRNRFVGPETTGTAESATLGLLAVTILFPASPLWVKMVAASLAAMLGTALFVAVIRRLPMREVMLVPIAGLVLSGVIGAIATFIGWQTDLLQYVNGWLMSGEFSGVLAGRYELLWVAAVAAGLAWFAADRFAILGLGDSVATGLGLSPGAVMRLGLAVVAVVTAMVITTVGLIPFVGLVVPNIVARIMGDNLRASIPVVAVFGAVLLLTCDLIGRLIRFPYEIPVGTILGVVGAVIFLWLLYRRPAHG